MSLTRPLRWFITVVVLSVALTLFSHTAASAGLRDVTQTAASPIEELLHATFAPVADFAANVGSYDDVRRQNARLEADNERLTVQVAQLQEQTAQNSQLGDLSRI